jgi:hypothetical protein
MTRHRINKKDKRELEEEEDNKWTSLSKLFKNK